MAATEEVLHGADRGQDIGCQMVRDVALDPDFAKAVDEGSRFTTRYILHHDLTILIIEEAARGER